MPNPNESEAEKRKQARLDNIRRLRTNGVPLRQAVAEAVRLDHEEQKQKNGKAK